MRMSVGYVLTSVRIQLLYDTVSVWGHSFPAPPSSAGRTLKKDGVGLLQPEDFVCFTLWKDNHDYKDLS